ncbi:hypothetical protein FACS1894181_05430 [Bacteroidia bacterium]|nr:hypothetical protein FACS1894181_05430 [Bacteroidia bacterium]
MRDKTIEELKEQLASKDIPDYQQTAKKYWNEGNLLKAIESVDTDMASDRAERLIFKAQLYIANFQFDEAEAHYKQAADIFPSYDNNFAAARFFYGLNRFKEAEDYYTRCLNQVTAPEERATVLNNLGEVQRNLNYYTQAEASYTEALKTYRELAAKNPQAYLPDVATTLNNLGILHRNNNKYPQAEASYTEALQIYRELAAKNPQAYLPYVANALNNLGVLHWNNKNYAQAEASYTEALQTYKDLAGKNPQAYLPYVANALNNLGVLQDDNKDYSQAEASLTEALQIRRELAAKNPQAYLPDVANTLVNLSGLYLFGTPDKAKSLQYAKEAIDVLHRCNDTPFVQMLLDKANFVIDNWKGKN